MSTNEIHVADHLVLASSMALKALGAPGIAPAMLTSTGEVKVSEFFVIQLCICPNIP
jgi:hypothetical protein